MAYIKLTEGKYYYPDDVIKAMEYIGDLRKCSHMVEGGRNIIYSVIGNPEGMARQFLSIQEGQRFNRRIYHLIISFDNFLDSSMPSHLKFIYEVGKALADIYTDYQSVFTVHENTSYLHLHMIINNCPVFTEKPKLSCILNLPYINKRVDEMFDWYLENTIQKKYIPYISK